MADSGTFVGGEDLAEADGTVEPVEVADERSHDREAVGDFLTRVRVGAALFRGTGELACAAVDMLRSAHRRGSCWRGFR